MLFAVARQLIVQDRRLNELEGILLTQWELDTPNDFTPGAQQWARNHGEYARSLKGAPRGGPRVGSVNMWKFYGLFDGIVRKLGVENPEVTPHMTRIVGMVTTEGKLDNSKIRNLWSIVRVCRVTEAKKKSYVSLHFTPEGAEIGRFVGKVLSQYGKLIEDAQPPTPAVQDLRKVLNEMGYWGPKKKDEDDV